MKQQGSPHWDQVQFVYFFFHTFGIMSAQEDGVKMGQVTVWARLGHLDGLTGGPGVHLYRK